MKFKKTSALATATFFTLVPMKAGFAFAKGGDDVTLSPIELVEQGRAHQLAKEAADKRQLDEYEAQDRAEKAKARAYAAKTLIPALEYLAKDSSLGFSYETSDFGAHFTIETNIEYTDALTGINSTLSIYVTPSHDKDGEFDVSMSDPDRTEPLTPHSGVPNNRTIKGVAPVLKKIGELAQREGNKHHEHRHGCNRGCLPRVIIFPYPP